MDASFVRKLSPTKEKALSSEPRFALQVVVHFVNPWMVGDVTLLPLIPYLVIHMSFHSFIFGKGSAWLCQGRHFHVRIIQLGSRCASWQFPNAFVLLVVRLEACASHTVSSRQSRTLAAHTL